MTPRQEWTSAPVLALGLISGIALIAGWQLFWFVCDDAYIAFRYVHNLVFGNGLVWNAAPFAPVEGYSSLLWVVLLGAVWTLTGVEPPVSSQWLGLGFGLGSLALVIRFGLRLPLSERMQGTRLLILGLVLFGTISNRTFLAWTSSGLEQGMFSFLLLAWLSVCVSCIARDRWAWALTGIAALLELTRPDGLLFVAMTGLMLILWLADRARAQRLRLRDFAPMLPLAVPVAHVGWRFAYYGELLPNTYYAKTVAAWPEAGLRYVMSFALEYAYVLWIPVAIAAGLRAWQRRRKSEKKVHERPIAQTLLHALPIATLLLHFGYYTFFVGGDTFEYRIYHHWVPLLMLLLPWLLDQAGFSARPALAYAATSIALGLVLPWAHWSQTRQLVTLHEAGLPHYRIAKHFPEPIRGWPESFDQLQGWLIKQRGIGLRHQTHKLFTTQVQWQRFPTRAEGLRVVSDANPIMLHRAVGYPGWALPGIAILDGLGLNDRVIARNPVRARLRRMAHERSPPAGYIECFRPNVFAEGGEVIINARSSPLTDRDIQDCEARFAEQTHD